MIVMLYARTGAKTLPNLNQTWILKLQSPPILTLLAWPDLLDLLASNDDCNMTG